MIPFLAVCLVSVGIAVYLTPRSNPEHMGHNPPDNFPAPLRWLSWLSRMLAVLEGMGIGFCLISLVSLAVWQFVCRNVRMSHEPFGWQIHSHLWWPKAPEWIDGVIRHSVFLLGFLGAAYATFTTRHIRIDAVTRMTKHRLRLVLRVVTTLAAITICLFLIRATWDFYKVTDEEAGEAAQAGQIFTSARGAMVMLLGYTLVAFHFSVQVALDLVWIITGRQPPPMWVSEATHGEAAVVAPPATNQENMMPPPVAGGGDA